MTEIVRIQIRQVHVGCLCDLLVNNNADHNLKLPKHLLNCFKKRCFPTDSFYDLIVLSNTFSMQIKVNFV